LQGNTQQTYFEIIIQDFGKGFDINKINEEGHYGLKNMQQRAKSVNAKLVITAATGKGATVAIKI
jgi:signal transduction histidine kinase